MVRTLQHHAHTIAQDHAEHLNENFNYFQNLGKLCDHSLGERVLSFLLFLLHCE